MTQVPSNNVPLRLTIVVVVFNSEAVIGECLASISPGVPIVVVDNGSTDSTVKRVRAVRPDAQVIENDVNMGYAVANNVGLGQVDTEFGMILNPDAVATKGSLQHLIAVLDTNPGAACVAPMLKSQHGEPEVYVMGPGENFHTRWKIIPEGEMCTWFLMGAAVVWRMSVWGQLGGFDENFFLYNEDADLSLRTTVAGYAHIFTPGAEVIHLGGQGAPRTVRQSWLRDWQLTWSNLYYQRKLGLRGITAQAAKFTIQHGLRAVLYVFLFRPGKVLREGAKCSASFQFLIGRGAHSASARKYLKLRR